MPRMPRQTYGTTVICYNNKSSTKDLENRIKKLEEALNKVSSIPTETPPPTVLPPEHTEVPAELSEVYFYAGLTSPKGSDGTGPEWVKESLASTVCEKGLSHTYTSALEELFPSVMYPESWGELSCIRQGGALAFDLLDVFVKEHVMKNGIPYLHYYFPDPLVVSEITFNFFWKD